MNPYSNIRKDIIEAWKRFVDNAYSSEDLALILESVRGDDHLREFFEVSDVVWSESLSNTPSLTKKQEETLRKEGLLLLAEYERKQGAQLPSHRRARIRKIAYAAAAVFLLGLLIPFASHLWKSNNAQEVVRYIEEYTQSSEIKIVTLPDQTSVTLNAESHIIYPDRFTDDERQVELFGEALFDVTADEEQPFIVKTEHITVRVLGTVFDVKAYKNDTRTAVSVASGTVEVDWKDGKALVEQNQQMNVDKTTGNFDKQTIDAEKYLSWTTGSLYFNMTPIREVVNMLNRFYPDTEIKLADGDYPFLISGEHSIDKKVEAALTSITYSTGLSSKKSGKTYILHRKMNEQ